MVLKVIRPVEGAERCAAISKYTSDRQGRERGRRQQLSDSYKPKPGEKELEGFDKFLATTARKPANELSEFESLLLLKKIQEDNRRMQESAKALTIAPAETEAPIEAAYLLGIGLGYRASIRK